jgi:hypothetical protein
MLNPFWQHFPDVLRDALVLVLPVLVVNPNPPATLAIEEPRSPTPGDGAFIGVVVDQAGIHVVTSHIPCLFT